MSNSATHDLARRIGLLEGQDRQRKRTADLIWRMVFFVLGSAVTFGAIWVSTVFRQPSLEEMTKTFGRDGTALKPVTRAVSSVETQHAVPASEPSEPDAAAETNSQLAESVDVVAEQLALVRNRAEKGGLRFLEGQGGSGALAVGEAESLEVQLTGGRQYLFVGACDQNCLDIDIRVLDPSDRRVVEEDVLPDDLPVVAISPSDDAGFSVEVKMFECSAASCNWGVHLYEQTTDLDIATEGD